MTKLLILTCACLLFVAHASSVPGQGKDEFRLSVGLTTGERGRDSSSQTTTLTVEGSSIVWQKTFGGRRRGTPPSRKQFALSSADKADLLKLIRSNHLLVTDSIELPLDAPVFYFRISLDLALDGKKGAINISGPRTAVKVKEAKLYQNTLTLVKELYRIMNSQDKTVRFQELTLEPISRY
jgi:hypothetical protein